MTKSKASSIGLIGDRPPEIVLPIGHPDADVSERVMKAAAPLIAKAMNGTQAHRVVQHGKETRMKTLDDVKADMSALYEGLKAGDVEIKQAAELANITGKYLKAEQLQLAREVFERGLPSRVPSLPQPMSMEEFNAG